MNIDQKHFAFLDQIVGLAIQKQTEKDPLNQQALNNIYQFRKEMTDILNQQQQIEQQQKEDKNDKEKSSNSKDVRAKN